MGDVDARIRLREMESRNVPAVPPGVPENQIGLPDREPESTSAEVSDGRQIEGEDWNEPLRRPRRSTVIFAVAAGLIIAVCATAVVVVQRVQVDPLQKDARQIARLAPDPSYTVPITFSGLGMSNAFQAFHGLRVVVGSVASPSTTSKGCLMVYAEGALNDPNAGLALRSPAVGCGAGTFPSAAQLEVGTTITPPELAAAFAAGTAIQFVYDAAQNEVVVFADR